MNNKEVNKQEDRIISENQIMEILRDNITFSPQVDGFVVYGAVEKLIELFKKWHNGLARQSSIDTGVEERFKKPTDQQVVKAAILFNGGLMDGEQLLNMVALADFIIDRLYENGDMQIPSSKEEK